MHWPAHRRTCPRPVSRPSRLRAKPAGPGRATLLDALPRRVVQLAFAWLDARALAGVLASRKSASALAQPLWQRLHLQFWPQDTLLDRGLEPEQRAAVCWRTRFRERATVIPTAIDASALAIQSQMLQGTPTLTHRDRPHDAADFGRCYRMLRVRPDWRARLWDMQHVSAEWYSLVREWPRLEAKYVREFRELAARTEPELMHQPYHADFPAWPTFLRGGLRLHWPPPPPPPRRETTLR